MEIEVLAATEQPERLVCQAARGDYYGGYIGDTEYAELMETVAGNSLDEKTQSFIEKEANRGHWGIWEHPQITFAIKGVPVFTERQLIRHRHLSFDVQSMRYADFSDAPYTVPNSLTDPNHFSREGDTEIDDMEQCREIYEDHMDAAFERYETLVENGVPKEDARGLLGLSTDVNLTVSGNARTMMHVFNLRQKADAQWSIRELANMMADELEGWMPYTGDWWERNGPMKLSP